jgi:hypothetical protein
MEFSFDVDKTISTLLPEVEQEIVQGGGTFSGNEQSGTFKGKGITGKYSVEGQTVKITITDKPFFIPDSKIKKEIKKYFNG